MATEIPVNPVDVKQFEALLQLLSQQNDRIARYEGQRASEEAQLNALLEKHGVESVEALEEKLRQAEADARALYDEVEAHTRETGEKLAELERALSQ
jgi:hypothetical protein